LTPAYPSASRSLPPECEHIRISGYYEGLPHLNVRFCQRSETTKRPDTPVPKVRQMHLAGMVMCTMRHRWSIGKADTLSTRVPK
jgi:hypothetical protein